ncbi:MAG: nitrilase family protein [Chitinophagaceae bacterium]|nr:nitrilase family protein [Chitinophagaceae bacterium]
MKPLTVTTIQADLHWENKQANLDMFEEKINAVKEKMEVVILPEMFSTGFSMKPSALAEKMDGASVDWMKRIAASKKIILTGSLIIEEGGHYYNRLIWMLPNGEYGYYDKRHLFGYAEEDEHYTPGFKRFIASVKGWKVNLQVCYDLRFPVWARQAKPLVQESPDIIVDSPEYDLLVYVANWPERRSHAWKTLLQARAIENQCYVVGVNRIGNDGNQIYHNGNTMIVNAMGEIIYTANDREEAYSSTLSLEELNEVRNKLPFLKDADAFMMGS